jgi:nucleoside-diphosphate-sugar epimerase
MVSSVSILGCGWLGRPLGARLAEQGVTVRGSTTTPDKLDTLRADGIAPVLLTLDPDLKGQDTGAFFESSVLVLNVPPPRGAEDVRAAHRRQVGAVRTAAAEGGVSWMLFASSTGVYPAVEQTVTEADVPPGQPGALPGPRRATGEALLEAEALLREADAFDTTVVRLGGLYGGERHPGRFLAGRTGLGRPHAPVNLIHRDDAVGVFEWLMSHEVRGTLVNACAPEHPTRRALYTRAAEAMGLDAPTFDMNDETTGKTVSSRRLQDEIGYTFRHPDPLSDVEA